MEAEYLKMDTETQAQYERRIKEMRDAKNVEDYARKKAIAEGLEKGLAEGLEKGLEKGRAAGRDEGIAIVLKALSLLKEGLSIQEVCQETGLSKEIVSALK